MTSRLPTLLIVDDDPAIVAIVERMASRCGFSVVSHGAGKETLARLGQPRADVALVDLCMPEVGGMALLQAIRATDPQCQVILMSGYGTVESAVEAVKLGALDYLTKPLDWARFRRLLGLVREDLERRAALFAAERDTARRLEFHGMVGRSPAMQEVFGLIRRISRHARSALVTGETGTGKELVARALHQLGCRSAKPFVAVNCSAVVETLFEKLNIVEIVLPPLRERREDIPYLTATFVQTFSRQFDRKLDGLTPAAEALLMSQPWPGNIRELRNVIERACMLAEGSMVSDRDIVRALPRGTTATAAPLPFVAGARHGLEQAEFEQIQRVLSESGGNKAAAARKLGINRRLLYRRLERLNGTDKSASG